VVLAAASAALLLLAVVLLALWRHSRRAARRAVRERAAAQRERLDLELQLAEQGSRLTMVRELHEIAVHSVSVIATQAEGAQYAASQDPSAATRSAAAIAAAARETLADLRRVMTVARGGEVDTDEQPGLANVQELFRVMRDAGLGVDFPRRAARTSCGTVRSSRSTGSCRRRSPTRWTTAALARRPPSRSPGPTTASR